MKTLFLILMGLFQAAVYSSPRHEELPPEVCDALLAELYIPMEDRKGGRRTNEAFRALIREAQAGNEDAYNRLVLKLTTHFWPQILRDVPGNRVDLATEAYSLLMKRLVEDLRIIRTDDKNSEEPSNVLYLLNQWKWTAVNRAKREYAKKGSEALPRHSKWDIEQSSGDEITKIEDEEESAKWKMIIRKTLSESTREGKGRLTDRDIKVLKLAYSEGKSDTEIAVELFGQENAKSKSKLTLVGQIRDQAVSRLKEVLNGELLSGQYNAIETRMVQESQKSLSQYRAFLRTAPIPLSELETRVLVWFYFHKWSNREISEKLYEGRAKTSNAGLEELRITHAINRRFEGLQKFVTP